MSKRQGKDESAVCKHVSRVMGDQKRSHAIVHEIQSWIRESGPEWVVKRLKALKQSIVNYLAFELAKPVSQRQFICPEWYASGRGGFPKGHLGGLTREVLTKPYSSRRISVLLSVCNTYTALVSTQVTRAQERKFLEAIGGRPPEGFDHIGSEYGRACLAHIPNTIRKMRTHFDKVYNESFNFGGLNTAKPTLGPWRARMNNWHPWTLSLIESTMVEGPWSKILSNMGLPSIGQGRYASHMGSIAVLQERGFKARVIAMPIAGIQVAFKPLHDALNSILKRIPQDCTHDQLAGIEYASQSLKEGKVVHAVDLSSATDNFPLAFQLEVLKAIGYPHWREFSQVARSQWESDYGKLTYSKGQPMGMYGSFSLFALSHHILLRGIEKEAGVKDSYRILGDDIIITDDKVHNLYITALKNMSIPISVDKCLDSDILTEFAGKLISHSGVLHAAKAPSQFQELLSVNNFINYCRATGHTNMIKDVPRKYREFAISLASLPPSFGGAGINPDGRSLLDRLSEYETVLSDSIPKMIDLSVSLQEIAFSGNPHVKRVCNFINDQLMEFYLEIDKLIKEKFPGLGTLAGTQDYKRSIAIQLLRIDDMDESLAFVGSLRDSEKSSRSVINDWKAALEAAGSSLSKTFDKHDVVVVNGKESLIPSSDSSMSRNSRNINQPATNSIKQRPDKPSSGTSWGFDLG